MQINPVAVYGILDTLQIPPGKYLLQSAAGSAFGRMLISLAKVIGCAGRGSCPHQSPSSQCALQRESATTVAGPSVWTFQRTGRSRKVELC
jgi:hypothetical protein